MLQFGLQQSLPRPSWSYRSWGWYEGDGCQIGIKFHVWSIIIGKLYQFNISFTSISHQFNIVFTSIWHQYIELIAIWHQFKNSFLTILNNCFRIQQNFLKPSSQRAKVLTVGRNTFPSRLVIKYQNDSTNWRKSLK